VRVLEAHREYLTHEDGRFTFGDLPSGRYTVDVRRLGHVADRQTVAVTRGATAALDGRAAGRRRCSCRPWSPPARSSSAAARTC
jgi:hypothetical protein